MAPADLLKTELVLPAELEALAPPAWMRAPETLHPSLWLGHQLGRRVDTASASGFPPLDAELPGNGWPKAALTELLLPHPGIGEIRLLAPAIVDAQKSHVVMLFDPPLQLDAAGMSSLGIDVGQLIVVTTQGVKTRDNNNQWALEQALKSGHVGAIVAWLPPRLRAEKLRRLQLAAHSHDGAAFMVREAAVRDHASAAPLRLELAAAGGDRMRLQVLKRRGPPLLEPLTLELPTVLSAAARRRLSSERAKVGSLTTLSLTQ